MNLAEIRERGRECIDEFVKRKVHTVASDAKWKRRKPVVVERL